MNLQELRVELRRFMTKIRAVQSTRTQRRRSCSDCAFNKATDDQPGWDSTAGHLMQAYVEGEPFACHFLQPLPGGGYRPRPRLCAAYESLLEPEEAERQTQSLRRRLRRARELG